MDTFHTVVAGISRPTTLLKTKQSPTGVLWKKVLLEILQIHRKTTAPESLFNKVAGRACNFIKKETIAEVFFCQEHLFLQNTSGGWFCSEKKRSKSLFRDRIKLITKTLFQRNFLALQYWCVFVNSYICFLFRTHFRYLNLISMDSAKCLLLRFYFLILVNQMCVK